MPVSGNRRTTHAAGDPSGGDAPWPATPLRFPARRSSIPRVRGFLETAIGRIEGDAVDPSGVLMAADVLATALIQHARRWSDLEAAVVHDEEDLYVRLSVPSRQGEEQVAIADRSLRLLYAMVDSVDLRVSEGRAFAVIQVPRH